MCVVLLFWCFDIYFVSFSSLTGSAACREVLCLSLGHWRHAQGYGGFRLRAWQEAQGNHGFWQTGNTYSNCVFNNFYLNSKCIGALYHWHHHQWTAYTFQPYEATFCARRTQVHYTSIADLIPLTNSSLGTSGWHVVACVHFQVDWTTTHSGGCCSRRFLKVFGTFSCLCHVCWL